MTLKKINPYHKWQLLHAYSIIFIVPRLNQGNKWILQLSRLNIVFPFTGLIFFPIMTERIESTCIFWKCTTEMMLEYMEKQSTTPNTPYILIFTYLLGHFQVKSRSMAMVIAVTSGK